jgi:hypothetical protein
VGGAKNKWAGPREKSWRGPKQVGGTKIKIGVVKKRKWAGPRKSGRDQKKCGWDQGRHRRNFSMHFLCKKSCLLLNKFSTKIPSF